MAVNTTCRTYWCPVCREAVLGYSTTVLQLLPERPAFHQIHPGIAHPLRRVIWLQVI